MSISTLNHIKKRKLNPIIERVQNVSNCKQVQKRRDYICDRYVVKN